MFVKETKVKRAGREYVYLQLVRGERDQHGRVRHKVVANLGRRDALKASGQLEALAGSFARLDPPMAGTRREVGALLLVSQLLAELDVAGIVDRAVPARSTRAQLSVGEVVTALIASRLCSPSPLYDVAGWASGAAMHELMGIPAALLNDDRLGRGLEAFAVYSETVRGAVAAAAIERYGLGVGRLHVDLTTIRVAGAYEDSALVAKGWGADRKVARQVRTLQACTPDGVPVYWRPDPGNASELALVGAGLERLAALTGAGPGLLVCDSACGNPKTLAQIQDAGLRFVVSLRASSNFKAKFTDEVGHEALEALDYTPAREARLPAEKRSRFSGCVRDWTLTSGEDRELPLRVAWIHSSEEGQQVAAARERALVKAETALGRVQRGLGGRHYPTRKHVDAKVATILAPHLSGLLTVTTATRNSKPTLTFARDQTAIDAAAATDGIYALATNHPEALSALEILKLYKDQQIIERRHRDAKQSLKVRPIFLHNDDRIHALISIVGLALLIFGLIETQTRQALGNDQQLAGLLPEDRAAIPTARNLLAAFQGLALTYTPAGIRLDRLTHTQRRILELLNITPPWPEQDT